MRNLFVVTFSLLIICGVYSFEDSYINQTSTSYGLKHAGPLVQKVTIPQFQSNGLFWSSNSYLNIFRTNEELLFVDRLSPAICFWTEDGELRRFHLQNGKEIISIHPLSGLTDQYIISLNNSIFHAVIKGGNFRARIIMDIVEDTDKVIKIKTGPKGRLWFTSSLLNKNGSLYQIQANKKVVTVDNSFQLPNGFAWSKDSKLFYVVDEVARKIFEYDFNINTGKINTTNKRDIFDANLFLPKGGAPTDVVVDTNGFIWIAVSEIAQIIQFDPKQRTVRQRVSVPPRYLTSLQFGGDRLQTLFVGTYGKAENRAINPDSGAVFAISGTGAKGFLNKQAIDSYIQRDY